MYNPVKDGIDKSQRSVVYVEADPPKHLSKFVHSFWELKTQVQLNEDFLYHVMPDACVNILFDQMDPKIAAVTALQTEFKTLNLGKHFHFVGVQLLPGVWRGNQREIKRDLVDTPYSGELSLVEVNKQIVPLNFDLKQKILIQLIEDFVEQKLILEDPISSQILNNMMSIQNVSDMATTVGLSPRQLQRKLLQTVGLPPHDFLKVLRIQQSFKQHYLDYYADQSHFIHSFRKITGYTPAEYKKKFNV